MRPGINFMVGLILGFLLAACITDSFSCETAQCRADREHPHWRAATYQILTLEHKF